MLAKLHRYFLYAWLLLWPWQTRYFLRSGELNGWWEYGTVSLYAADFLLLLVIITSFKQLRPLKWRALILPALFLLWSWLTILWSADQALALYYAIRLSLALGLFIILIYSRLKTTRLFSWLITGGVLQSLFAILQFISQRTWSNKWLGLTEHLPATLGQSVLEINHTRVLRAYGSLPHPNILGGYLALTLIVSFFIQPTNRWRSLYRLGQTFLIIGLLVTFSRSAWLSVLVGTISYAVYQRQFIIKQIKKITWWRVIPVVLILLGLIDTNVATITGRFTGQGRLEQISITERVSSLNDVSQLITLAPWQGLGLGQYTLALAQYLRPHEPGYTYQPIHNVWLLMTVELGLLGVLLFALFFLQLWRHASQKSLARPMLIAMFILMLFDHYLWSLPFGLYFFGLTLALSQRQV